MLGRLSSIQRFGLFSTTTECPIFAASFPLSAYRPLAGRTGHGKTFEAETVKTVAKKVRAKRDDVNVLRC